MAPLRLLCLPGDGIGPEIMGATRAALDALGPYLTRPLAFEDAEIGWAALKATGCTIPDDVIARAKAADGLILGPVSHNDYPPREEGGLNPSGVLRKALDLYANIRPARTWKGVEAPARRPFDLIVARENLEGFYADRNMVSGPAEIMVTPGVAVAIRRITAHASRRIAEAAFRLAAERRGKVTAVHKANVMRLTDGLFLDTVREVAADHPGVALDEMLVDAAAAHLVRDPSRFDVIVTTNMFGDILSDLASELGGGLGLAGSLNAGPEFAVAQAQHGSAPDIAGRDRANPSSLMLSAAMLLRHRGETAGAEALERAVEDCLERPESRTMDLGGALGCAGFGAAVAAAIERIDE